MPSMPNTDSIALLVIAMTSCIVFFDAWKLFRASKDIPNIGKFKNGGMAWKSLVEQEVMRNLIMIGTVILMMALPWLLAERSGTNLWWVVTFDILLFLHVISLIIPKRYAITKDALWVDGFRLEWTRLWWTGWKGGHNIKLQRKGWWRLAPLPLGGSSEDIEAAAVRIDAVFSDQWAVLLEIISEEE